MSSPYNPALRFLVIDDMLTMRKIVSQQLRALGFQTIVEASDGAIAWEKLTKATTDKTPFNFIVSDWNMPNLSGLDLLKKCRATPEYKDIAFLLVTAEAEITQVKEAIQAGTDNYVMKPFTPASFKEKFDLVYKKRIK